MRISGTCLLACVVAVFCSVGLPGVLGQVAPGGVVADRYAGESIVIVRSESVYSMAADGTGWRQKTMAARVQSEAAVKQLGVLSIPYAGSAERVEIAYARVRRADGTVVETPVGDALEMPDAVTREAPFYSDLRQKQLPIRNLRVGDTLEWQAKIVRTKAEAPGEFWGQDGFVEDAVVLEQTIELRVPAGKAVTVWSPGHTAVEKTDGGERVYRWTYSQVKPTTGKEAEAAAEAKKKAVWTAEQEVDFREGRLPGIAWTTFPNWEAVGAWYRGLEGDRMEAAPEVTAKVAEVTAGKATEEEKVRAVYGYVATQVRYIGVAFGVGRYQPHRAAEVLENQYGDCKDKHTLLAAMLGVLGLKADAVLIGAGVRFNPAVPSPGAFNHLITRVQVAGKTVWLDTTAEVAPYGMLVAVIRDHAALVVPEVGVAKVERTPVELPFKPFQKLDAVGTLDKDGISDSKMTLTLTLRGDGEVLVRAALRQIPPAQYEQLVQNISQAMNFGGVTSHAEISRAEDTAEPLVIRYDYHREKVGDWDNLKTLAQLAPVALPIPDEKDPPIRAIDLGGVHVETSTAAMKLPEGWTAELPEAVHARSKYVNWDQTYRLEKGTLYSERKVEVLVDRVPVSEWREYKKWTDVTTPGNELYVQLVKPVCAACGVVKPGKGSEASSTTGEKTVRERAGALVQTAYEATRRNDVDGALPLLDQARSLDEHARGLWLTYGYAAYRRAKWAEAAQDYEKELARWPDQVGLYRDLATANLRLGEKDEAVAVARRWVAAQPTEPQATVLLTNLLEQKEQYAEAVEAAESGIAALPEDQRQNAALRLALGTAQMKAGMKEKGSATLAAVLTSSDDALMLNDAAYELADAGQELAQAETGTRKALDKLAQESRTWTLDESVQILGGKSGLTVATWDTMGWVLFREGKMKEAESYLRAAWTAGPSETEGEHLGDVLAAEGDRGGAARAYDLALSTRQTMPGQQGEVPSTLRIRGKMVAVGVKDGHVAGLDAQQAPLVKMRTVPLGPAGGLSGAAEYKMLLSAEGVLRAVPTGDKSLPRGEAMIKKAKVGQYFPAGSEARLVRAGILNCHSGVCEMVFLP